MGFDGFFRGCTFCCAFFPAMPLDILVLENVSWWYWGAGSTAKMQVLKTLQQGSYIFWFLGFPGNSGIIWVLMVFSRLYILLRILSSNAFGHFGLGKCKLLILRCRFHGKNAGFEDLTTGILHFLVPRIPWGFWYYVGFDWFFSRLYILLRILSSNAFGHFGLGKCKLMILRCRFHCKNAGFEDFTTGILHFLVPRIPWEFWYYMGFDGFFLGCTFSCAFFPAMPLDILVLENVGWWYWGAGSTAKMQVLKTLQHGSYIFWFLGFPGNSGIMWVLMVFF